MAVDGESVEGSTGPVPAFAVAGASSVVLGLRVTAGTDVAADVELRSEEMSFGKASVVEARRNRSPSTSWVSSKDF
jgi:hypothetical protein